MLIKPKSVIIRPKSKYIALSSIVPNKIITMPRIISIESAAKTLSIILVPVDALYNKISARIAYNIAPI